MTWYTVAFCTLVLIANGETCSKECKILVNIDSGPVCGRVEVAENSTKFYSFQGIPYAKPPTGARRFSELEPVESWTETFYAYEEGPACPSRDLVYGSIPVKPKGMSEDCIYANVFVPVTATLKSDEQTEDKLLPILVNIHGGGFYAGSGNRDLHGPEFLLTKEVIVINFNYRAIISSGTGAIPAFFSASTKYAQYVANSFLSALGINSTDTDEIYQTLIELPLEVIMKANDVVQYNSGLTSFVPTIEIEGHNYTRVVDKDPMVLMAEGRGKDIPLIIGFNENEAETFRWVMMMLGIISKYESNPAAILSPRLAFELSTEEASAKAQLVAQKYFGSEPSLDGFVKVITEEYFQYPSQCSPLS